MRMTKTPGCRPPGEEMVIGMQRCRRGTAPALCGLALLLAGCGDSSEVAQDTNAVIHYANAFGTYTGLVYIPGSVRPDTPAPLVVLLHGANTTAEQMRAAARFDPVAAREGFIMLYPDTETDGAIGEHLLQSWHFYDPLEMVRGVGDPQAIADLTQQVITGWNVDPERVYVVGMSAGGWETSIMGATYPDLYAAIGIAEGGAYGIGIAGVGQPLGPDLTPPQVLALAARAAMGSHARVLPVISFQGEKDPAATPASGQNAIQQWLMTNNLVVSGKETAPFPLAPTKTVDVTPADGGYPYHVDTYQDGNCLILEQVRIENMQHYWPGGTTDAKLRGFTDPKAPSGAEMSWAFFKRLRKSDTAPPCAASRP